VAEDSSAITKNENRKTNSPAAVRSVRLQPGP
jgi:hypothetical protein